MNKTINKKIELSNKIFPLYSGLSSGLVFFIAINVLFLTEVKGFNPSEINLIRTVAVLVALFFYLFSHKIIKKIGNIFSIRFGTFLLLVSALLFTFSKSLVLIILAEILYELSFVFKSVDAVILSNNLNYQKKEKDFIRIKFKATSIYSVATLISSLLAGILFSINPYIPMVVCILICINNYILSCYIYEIDSHEKEKKSSKIKFNISKIVFMNIIVYGLLYGTMAFCQTDDKMFMQYRLQDFLNINKVAISISVILFIARIARLLSNMFFLKIYDKIKDKIIYIINFSLIISILLFIIGKLISNALIGSILMAIGYTLLMSLMDPTENLLSNIILKHTLKERKEQIMLYFQFARRLIIFILSLFATMILAKHEFVQLYYMILGFTILYLFAVSKLLHLIRFSKANN